MGSYYSRSSKVFWSNIFDGHNIEDKNFDVWSEDPLYRSPLFGAIMSRNCYQLLLRFLHNTDNSTALDTADADRDRLYKLCPVLDHLFEKFQSVYDVSKEVSVDDSLLLWKGRLFRQYLPLKRSRFWIKLYKLCESRTGYTYRLRYTLGKTRLTNYHPVCLFLLSASGTIV